MADVNSTVGPTLAFSTTLTSLLPFWWDWDSPGVFHPYRPRLVSKPQDKWRVSTLKWIRGEQEGTMQSPLIMPDIHSPVEINIQLIEKPFHTCWPWQSSQIRRRCYSLISDWRKSYHLWKREPSIAIKYNHVCTIIYKTTSYWLDNYFSTYIV